MWKSNSRVIILQKYRGLVSTGYRWWIHKIDTDKRGKFFLLDRERFKQARRIIDKKDLMSFEGRGQMIAVRVHAPTQFLYRQVVNFPMDVSYSFDDVVAFTPLVTSLEDFYDRIRTDALQKTDIVIYANPSYDEEWMINLQAYDLLINNMSGFSSALAQTDKSVIRFLNDKFYYNVALPAVKEFLETKALPLVEKFTTDVAIGPMFAASATAVLDGKVLAFPERLTIDFNVCEPHEAWGAYWTEEKRLELNAHLINVCRDIFTSINENHPNDFQKFFCLVRLYNRGRRIAQNWHNDVCCTFQAITHFDHKETPPLASMLTVCPLVNLEKINSTHETEAQNFETCVFNNRMLLHKTPDNPTNNPFLHVQITAESSMMDVM